ncbi:hypothetical protein [Sphaerisporangium perillae]|uniref:hypothetical protein n=1 Tax=Sphaerisporangium perillae TaxID=2935860 RepID=UPI00200D832E|nr:hypothetical protein [Sphaerisporangium perillae]
MAVPPIQAAGLASLGRVNRLPLVLDVIVGLLAVVALPLAIVAVPNTISVVSALLPPDIAGVWILRAHGLALPVMLCTVPLAAAVLRRVPAAPMLVTGLACLAVADVAGGFAGSTLGVGALRALHGIGAGVLVPATLAAVGERPGASRNVLLPVWAGALAVGLLAAQALALWPLDEVTSWRVTLQPYPLLTGVALALAAVHFTLSRLSREPGREGGTLAREIAETTESAETAAATVAAGSPTASGTAESAAQASGSRKPVDRGHLALAAGPSAGIAVLAVGTTFDWPSGLIMVAAAIGVVTLLAMAYLGRVEGPGGRLIAFVMVAVGLVVLPTAAQVTYVELGGLGGPGLSGLWIPFGLAALIALAAASVAARLSAGLVPKLVGGGLVAMVVGLCAVRLLVPSPSGMPLVVPFVLLTAGAAVAVTSAVRCAGYRAALFGLSLCFPAVLSGFLLGTGIQVGWLRAVSMSGKVTSEAMVEGFVGALHIWALAAGFTVVIVLILGAVLVRRSYDSAPPDTVEYAEPRHSAPSDVKVAPREATGPASPPAPAAEPADGASSAADSGTAAPPVVPPPTRSPEGATGEDGDGAAAR